MLDKNESNINSSSGVFLVLNNPSQSNRRKILSSNLLKLNHLPSVHLADETPNLEPNILFRR